MAKYKSAGIPAGIMTAEEAGIPAELAAELKDPARAEKWRDIPPAVKKQIIARYSEPVIPRQSPSTTVEAHVAANTPTPEPVEAGELTPTLQETLKTEPAAPAETGSGGYMDGGGEKVSQLGEFGKNFGLTAMAGAGLEDLKGKINTAAHPVKAFEEAVDSPFGNSAAEFPSSPVGSVLDKAALNIPSAAMGMAEKGIEDFGAAKTKYDEMGGFDTDKLTAVLEDPYKNIGDANEMLIRTGQLGASGIPIVGDMAKAYGDFALDPTQYGAAAGQTANVLMALLGEAAGPAVRKFGGSDWVKEKRYGAVQNAANMAKKDYKQAVLEGDGTIPRIMDEFPTAGSVNSMAKKLSAKTTGAGNAYKPVENMFIEAAETEGVPFPLPRGIDALKEGIAKNTVNFEVGSDVKLPRHKALQAKLDELLTSQPVTTETPITPAQKSPLPVKADWNTFLDDMKNLPEIEGKFSQVEVPNTFPTVADELGPKTLSMRKGIEQFMPSWGKEGNYKSVAPLPDLENNAYAARTVRGPINEALTDEAAKLTNKGYPLKDYAPLKRKLSDWLKVTGAQGELVGAESHMAGADYMLGNMFTNPTYAAKRGAGGVLSTGKTAWNSHLNQFLKSLKTATPETLASVLASYSYLLDGDEDTVSGEKKKGGYLE